MRVINVVAFGGLGGNAFSAGLKTILMRLSSQDGVDFHTYADYKAWRTWGRALPSWSDATVVLGHSFGVTAMLAAVRLMEKDGPRIPLAVSFDPSQWWWSNPSLASSGGNSVPERIEDLLNFYQVNGPIGRQTLARADGTARNIENRVVLESRHGSLEDRRDLQDETIDRIKRVIESLNQSQ